MLNSELIIDELSDINYGSCITYILAEYHVKRLSLPIQAYRNRKCKRQLLHFATYFIHVGTLETANANRWWKILRERESGPQVMIYISAMVEKSSWEG